MSPYGAPTKHVVKMASPVVTCMPSLNLKRTKRQRSGQAYHILSMVSKSLCSLCMSRDMSVINGRHVNSTHWSLNICCRQRQQSPKDRLLFRSFSSMHGSGSIMIFATGWLAIHFTPHNSTAIDLLYTWQCDYPRLII